jgi:uncharacterized membrane protein
MLPGSFVIKSTIMKQIILISVFTFLGTALFAQHNAKDEMAIKNIIKEQENAGKH